MAVRKRPAAAVDRQGAHASFRGKRRVVVARRTCPGHITIKKPAAAAAYDTTTDYDVEDTPSPCLVEAASGAVNKTPHRPMGHTAVAINFPSTSLPPPELAQEQLLLLETDACDGSPHVGADAGTAEQAPRAVSGPGGDAVSEEGLQVLIERATQLQP